MYGIEGCFGQDILQEWFHFILVSIHSKKEIGWLLEDSDVGYFVRLKKHGKMEKRKWNAFKFFFEIDEYEWSEWTEDLLLFFYLNKDE